jgi:hypothetical protein
MERDELTRMSYMSVERWHAAPKQEFPHKMKNIQVPNQSIENYGENMSSTNITMQNEEVFYPEQYTPPKQGGFIQFEISSSINRHQSTPKLGYGWYGMNETLPFDLASEMIYERQD